MGGSLLSKFRRRRRKIAPLINPPDVKEKQSCISSTIEKNTFEEQAVVAEKPSVEKVPVSAEAPIDNASSAWTCGSDNQFLKLSPAVMKARVLEDFEEIVRQAKKEARVLESAREILAAQSTITSSRSTNRALTPRAAVETQSVSLGSTPGSTAFEILLGERRTISAAARMPRRLRRLVKDPKLTAEDVAKKMKAVEKKRLEALECTRTAAQVKKTEHPAEGLSQSTARKVLEKMSKAEFKRNEAIERKKQAGEKFSQAKRTIVDAQVYAHEQIKSSIEGKKKNFEMRQVECATRMADKKRRREAHAKSVKEKARYAVPEEECHVPLSLELETDDLYCVSDTDESWDTERASLWKDFGF